MKSAPGTLHDYLKKVLHHVSNELLTESYRTRLLQIGYHLPLLKHGILEFRLSPYEEQVDLMVNAFNTQAERGTLATWESHVPGGPDLSGLQELSTAWSDTTNQLKNRLENIYIVFDNHTATDPIPKPWLYLAFHKLTGSTKRKMDWFQKTMDFVPGEPTPGILHNLEKCFNALTGKAWIFGYSFMVPRGKHCMRIGIADFSSLQEIMTFLKAIDWPGNTQTLQEEGLEISTCADSLVLALDFEEEIIPRIGIECVMRPEENQHKANRMLPKLLERELCTPDQAGALQNWIGTETRQPEHPEWPFPQPHQPKLQKGISGGKITRWLNHVKIIHEPQQALKTKAYLYYNHAWK